MFEDEIVELQLAGAIKDTEEMAVAPFDKQSVRSYLEDYADVFEALKESINYLPVPLDIMHTQNVCTYFRFYRQFEELDRLYNVANTCTEGLIELHETQQKKEQESDLEKWLGKYEEVSVEAFFLPEKDPNSNYLTFHESGIKILIPNIDYDAIFELTEIYYKIKPNTILVV